MTDKNADKKDVAEPDLKEDVSVMIFGNIKIIDLDTGELIVNKRG